MLCKSTLLEDPATKLQHAEALRTVEQRAQAIAADVGVCDGEEARGVYGGAAGAADGGDIVSGKFNS